MSDNAYINDLETRLAEALATVEKIKAEMSGLLARIHRDGGHYESKHGTDKAFADAHEVVAAALGTLDECRRAGFIDERGEVRKIAHNATLPITADGYIAVYGETYLYWDTINNYHDPIKYGWTERELESCPPHDAEYSWTTDPSLCYYDRAAAAKGGGQ